MSPQETTPTRVSAQLVRDLTTAGMAVKHEKGFTPFVIVPEGFEKKELEREPLLDHIKQGVKLEGLESFIAYVKQFQTATTRIFSTVSDTGAHFVSILDYHEGGRDGNPKHAEHFAAFAPKYTPEFQAWLSVDGQGITQSQFLDYLRKWGDTITSHSDADLIELASALDFDVAGQYSSHVERTKGGRKLLFNEIVEGSSQVKGAKVEVPDSLTLKLPVFNGGKEYELGADLLYRPQNGALRIIVELRRVHKVIRQAVKDIVADVKAGTEIEPFLGRPITQSMIENEI